MSSTKPNFNELVKKMGFEDNKGSKESVERVVEPIKREPVAQPLPVEKAELNNVTYIADDVVITGDIKAKQDIEFYGEIKGNIETTGMLQLHGRVLGNVKADNLILQSADVQGNLTSNNQISIDKDTVVMGDLSANMVIIGGELNGDIFAQESLLIREQAVIKGDITTGLIDIRQGAKISGKIETGEMPAQSKSVASKEVKKD